MFKLLFYSSMIAAFLQAGSLQAAEKESGSDQMPSGKVLFEHSGFEAFAQGEPGDAGANVYVTHSGEVRTIHTWDYDGDGNTDILVNNDHNHVDNSDLLIYRNRPGRNFGNLVPPLPDMAPLMHQVRWIRDAQDSVISLPSLGGGRVIIQDLNRDGWPDMAFCNFIHGWAGRHFEVYIYWGGPEGFTEQNRSALPTLTAHGIAAADLNGDGWPDLVLANRGYEYVVGDTSNEDEESYIYWGGPEGFSPARRLSLPTKKAVDVAISDLNGDGHLDIVFANHARNVEESIVIYWGGPDGPDPENQLRIETTRPTSVLVQDLDGDGQPDIFVGHKNDEPAEIFYNDGTGGFRRHQLPIKYVSDAAVADLDGDGHVDLVLAVEISYQDGDEFTAAAIPGMPAQDALLLGERSSYHSASMVFWGSPDGFETRESTKLPTIGPSAVAIHDLDGDGHPELIFANRLDGQTFDVPSYIYWGSADGYAPYHRTELQGFGAMDVAVVDADHDGLTDVVLVNRLSGKTRAPLDSLVYWGNPKGHFSPSFMTRLPARTPLGSAAADLNNDGFPEIIYCNQGDDAFIYWGSAQGYALTNRTELPIRQSYTCEIVDLNRDGYLDLIFTGRLQGKHVNAVIFWGDANGFDPDRKRVLDFGGERSRGVAVGDMDGDGQLDLLLTTGDSLNILKGPDFAWEGRIVLPGLTPGAIQLADLNGDGRLDIFLVNYQCGREGVVPSYIYWNGPMGFNPANRTELTTLGASSASVADLNNDGALDIVTAHYNTGTRRSMPTYIFWGALDGSYSESRRSELPAESAHDLFIADLDRSGYKDIVIFNHTREHDHGFGTWIYRGSEAGFSEQNRSLIPSFGVHVHRGVDQGNIRDRRFEETYVSAPVEIDGTPEAQLVLGWQADCSLGSTIRFQVRTAASREALAQAKWDGPTGADSYFDGSEPKAGLPLAGATWVQYKAFFRSADGSNYPILREVKGQSVE